MVDIRTLERQARRHVRTLEEAQDVVQDVLLAAVSAGRRLEDPTFPRWACGAIRKRAAFLARSAGRRRRREQGAPPARSSAPPRFPGAFLDSLPPSLRVVARLADAGLDRREIAWLLGLGDDAFRQRLGALRLRWRRSGLTHDVRAEGDGGPPLGLMRQTLRRRLAGGTDVSVGSHDPDGHLLIFSQVRSRMVPARQQDGVTHLQTGNAP